MTTEFEKEIPWSWWQSIWVIWFDMDCDWTVEYVKKMFKPSKIDQVLTFYGIPFIYKNEYRKYLKYRIQKRHYWIVNDYFTAILASEWYDVSDFDYWKLQDDYNISVPVAEHTWLNMHVNYDDFLKKDAAHREALIRWWETEKDQQIQNMLEMMAEMREEMKLLKNIAWQPNALLSKENTNDWTSPSWSDSTTNAEWNESDVKQQTNEIITPHEHEETWLIVEDQTDSIDWHAEETIQWASKRIEWVELIWSLPTNSSDIWESDWWTWTSETTETKKDRRTS